VSPPLIEARRLETLWVEDDAEMFLPRAKQPAGSVLLQVEYPELRVPRDLEPDLDAISPSLTICSTSLIQSTGGDCPETPAVCSLPTRSWIQGLRCTHAGLDTRLIPFFHPETPVRAALLKCP
uniref:Uncharacterized protein n=1 Tax=Gasterosteus aculeatus aculeatus TaxID=481459 RepID=A0AAQ4QVL1_GASAC